MSNIMTTPPEKNAGISVYGYRAKKIKVYKIAAGAG
jgi:hypothetical protein